MSVNENNIDQLFNEAAHAEKTPLFNEAYWSEMQGLLAMRAAKRKKIVVWFFAGTFVFSALIVALFLQNDSSNLERYISYNSTGNQWVKTAVESGAFAQIKKNTQLTPSRGEDQTTTDGKHAGNGSAKHSSYMKEQGEEQTANTTRASGSVLHRKGNLTNVKNPTSTASALNKQQNNTVKSGILDKNILAQRESNSKESTRKLNTTPTQKNLSNQQLAVSTLSVNTINQLKTPEIPSTLEKVMYPSAARFRLYAQLGGGLMENYATKSPLQSGVFNLAVGFEAKLHNLSIRTGLGSQLTTNADLVVSKRTKSQTFGVEEYQSDLSYQQLVDIYIPIELGYQLHSVTFGIGLQENYLLTSKMKASYYADHLLTHSESLKGFTDGLQRFTTLGYLWVSYRFSPLFSVGAKMGTNLTTRIKEGEYFNNSLAPNPLYGQLTLRFDFMK